MRNSVLVTILLILSGSSAADTNSTMITKVTCTEAGLLSQRRQISADLVDHNIVESIPEFSKVNKRTLSIRNINSIRTAAAAVWESNGGGVDTPCAPIPDNIISLNVMRGTEGRLFSSPANCVGLTQAKLIGLILCAFSGIDDCK